MSHGALSGIAVAADALRYHLTSQNAGAGERKISCFRSISLALELARWLLAGRLN